MFALSPERLGVAATQGAVVSSTGCVQLWIVKAGKNEFVFNSLDDAGIFRDEWDDLHGQHEAAQIRSAAFTQSDLFRVRHGCRLVAVEIPTAIAAALRIRCTQVGVNPHRMVSSLINWLLTTYQKDPRPFLDAFEQQEKAREAKLARRHPRRPVADDSGDTVVTFGDGIFSRAA